MILLPNYGIQFYEYESRRWYPDTDSDAVSDPAPDSHPCRCMHDAFSATAEPLVASCYEGITTELGITLMLLSVLRLIVN